MDLKLTNNSGIYGCLPDGLPSFEVKCGPPPAPTCPTFTDDPLVGTLQAGTQLKQYCWQEEQAEALKNGTLHRCGVQQPELTLACSACGSVSDRPTNGLRVATRSDDVDALALKKRLVPKHVPPVVCPPVPVGPMPVEAGVSLTKHVPGSAEGVRAPATTTAVFGLRDILLRMVHLPHTPAVVSHSRRRWCRRARSSPPRRSKPRKRASSIIPRRPTSQTSSSAWRPFLGLLSELLRHSRMHSQSH